MISKTQKKNRNKANLNPLEKTKKLLNEIQKHLFNEARRIELSQRINEKDKFDLLKEILSLMQKISPRLPNRKASN